jgi:hypothetical protein
VIFDKPQKINAILSLHPEAQFVLDKDHLMWHSPDIPEPSDDAIATELARLTAIYDSETYSRNRKDEYPNIEELVVALWESVVEERLAPAIELQAKRQAIKNKYPKE